MALIADDNHAPIEAFRAQCRGSRRARKPAPQQHENSLSQARLLSGFNCRITPALSEAGCFDLGDRPLIRRQHAASMSFAIIEILTLRDGKYFEHFAVSAVPAERRASADEFRTPRYSAELEAISATTFDRIQTPA
jgi:hypothetical protein